MPINAKDRVKIRRLIAEAQSRGIEVPEETKNRLIAEAKNQASQMAHELVKKMQSEVQKSAVQTLEVLAKSGNAEAVPFLTSKIIEWEAKAAETSVRVDADTGVDDYETLKAEDPDAIMESIAGLTGLL